jgi:hypothetical protein
LRGALEDAQGLLHARCLRGVRDEAWHRAGWVDGDLQRHARSRRPDGFDDDDADVVGDVNGVCVDHAASFERSRKTRSTWCSATRALSLPASWRSRSAFASEKLDDTVNHKPSATNDFSQTPSGSHQMPMLVAPNDNTNAAHV